MNVIGVIPARGGSKGVPRKNVRLLNDKPLVVYSIEAALKSDFIGDVIVSTDDDEIEGISKEVGAEVIRRHPELALDDSLVIDAVRHVLQAREEQGVRYELMVLLEPTAPFRTKEDIDGTIKLLIDKKADSAATFSETEVPPTRIWKIEDEVPVPFIPGSDPFLPRQKQKKGYALNGMVYALKTATLAKHPGTTSFLLGQSVAYIIPRNRVVDIDTEKDFLEAEQLLKTKQVILK